MASVLEPALQTLDKSLLNLEKMVDQRLREIGAAKVSPQLDLSARNEREVNKKIASRLDQTIDRLEMLLTED